MATKKPQTPAHPAEQPITPGIEPNPEEGAAPAPGPVAPEGDDNAGPPAPLNEAERKELVKQKAYGARPDPRADIYKRRTVLAEAERQEFHEQDPEQARISDELAAGASPAGGQPPGEEDDGGEGSPAEGGAPSPAPAPAAPASPAPAPVALNQGKVKIKVDGVEQEVSTDEVHRAGIEALQKRGAADARLRDASTYEARLRDHGAYLAKVQANLEQGLDADGRPIRAQGAPVSPSPPSSGAAAPTAEQVRASVKSALDLIVQDKSDEAAERLTELIVGRAGQAAPAQPAGPQPAPTGAESRTRLAPVPTRRGREEIREANEVFNTEYSDLAQDDRAFAYTQALVKGAIADQANDFRSLTDIYREAANSARQLFGGSAAPAPGPAPAPSPAPGPAPAPQPAPAGPTPGQQAHEARRNLKARIPLAPAGASARAPAPGPSGPPIPSNKDYVRQLQRANKSNSSPR